MSLIIQKFGGTSLADLNCIKRVADIVASTRKNAHDVVVVVSAMEGETDRLIQLIHSLTPNPDLQEYDAIVSTGEQISAALLSMALQQLGCPACSYSAPQARIFTDDRHLKASILGIDPATIKADINNGKVPVIAGFQGVNSKGCITTLGRGGSDMSAVAMAAALNADECQIYSDVDGVYTADPKVVKEARCLSHITYNEMLELARLGAKILQLKAVEFAQDNKIPIRVLSTFESGAGTLITEQKHDMSLGPIVSGIAFDRNQAKLSILGVPSDRYLLNKIMAAAKEAAIDVDMMIKSVASIQDAVDFSFTVHLDDFKQAFSIVERLAKEVKARDIVGDDNVAKLSLIGLGMKSHAGVATKVFSTLGEKGIDIHLITSSEIKISAVIHEKYMEAGARALHMAFGLASPLESSSRAV